MKIKMTIDECLEFADEWSRGMTYHEGSQGWRVVCMLLAEEVRRYRTEDANAVVQAIGAQTLNQGTAACSASPATES